MYNGIGLQTARGSGTNGYVQSNLSHLMQARRKIEYNGEEDLRKMEAELNKKPNEEIMDHNRKRQVEVKCAEFEMLLEDKGFDDEEIDKKVNEFRQNLLKQLESGDLDVDKELDTRESHARRRAAAQNRDRMRNALGLGDDYVPGSSMAKMNKSDVVGAALDSELPQENDKEKLLETLRQHQKDKKKSKKSKRKDSSSSSSSDSDSDSDSSSSSSSSEDEKSKRRRERKKKEKKQKRKEMEQRREKLKQKEKELLAASEIKKEEPDSSDEPTRRRDRTPDRKDERRRDDRDKRRERSVEDRRRRSIEREDRRDNRDSRDQQDRRRQSPERRRQRSRSVENRRRDERREERRDRSPERRRRHDSSDEEGRTASKKAKVAEMEVKQEPLSDYEDAPNKKVASQVTVVKRSSRKSSSSSSSGSDSGSGSSSSSSSSSSSDSDSD